MVATGCASESTGSATRLHSGRKLTGSSLSVGAVILAAGASSRMGHPKQLLLFEGRTLLARAVTAAADAEAQPVIVVLGANATEIREAGGIPAGIRIVVNARWSTGLASSLTAGLRAFEEGSSDGILVTLADQPSVDASLLRKLMAAFRSGSRIVATDYDGAPGVPALFGREHVPELLSLTGDAGAGPWLRAKGREVTVVAPERPLIDIDRPADLDRLADRNRSC